MVDTREELQAKLEEMFGNRNVYYQLPTSLRMNYPAIRYSKKNLDVKHADDKKYTKLYCYEIIVISKQPDHPIIEQLLELSYCSYDRHYVSDNLHHDVLTLYY